MAKFRAILFFIAVITLAFGVNAMAAGNGKYDSDGSLAGTAVTTSQTAVFAAFLSNSGPVPGAPSGINTAISISNILKTPPFKSDFLNIGGADQSGTITFHLWNQDGTGYMYNTGSSCKAGGGLSPSGELGPGQTYTVLLADILGCIPGLTRTSSFNGYGWAVGNFDAIAGTETITIFGTGFNQSFVMTPAVGQGSSFTGGIPVMNK